MELHEIFSVTATSEASVYSANVEITDASGARYQCEYVSRIGDIFGLAPAIRSAVEQWIADGKSVAPYVPPTSEELRASMPSITARQLRLGLVTSGISLAQVEAAIAAIEDEQERTVAEIEWQYAVQFERIHPLIAQVGTSLGLTPEQIDTMWQAALQL